MPPKVMPSDSAGVQAASGVVIFSFLIAVLFLGRVVLEPLAIAVLLGFILAPPIRRLRRLHAGRIASVIIVVVFALAIIAGLGFVMEMQITRLAADLPKYQSNLQTKITSLNNALVPSGALEQASSTLNDLADELKNQRSRAGGNAAQNGALKDQSVTPVPVEVRAPQPPTLERLQNLISPLVTPLAMGSLIILFLVFILFYREDLRDRVLRLAGTRDLQRTTEAMNEAGKRLSRYFTIQSAINGAFGVFIGCALWIIGVPNAALWGMLAAILRFLPYLGTPIAAVFPLVLASAIDPGWSKVIATAILFFGGEVVTGQAIEPVLQGQHTGLSPVAIVIATLFWTLIWGPAGLVLAVPITVCISVLGKHVDALSFLGILLGDEPALAAHEGFYQRLLAGDATEATFQAEEQLATKPLSGYYDDVPMKAIALAQADAAAGRLSRDQQIELHNTIDEFVEELSDYSDAPKDDKEASPEDRQTEKTTGNPKKTRDEPPVSAAPSRPILLVAARTPLDRSASLLLAHILKSRGLEALVEPYHPNGRGKDHPPATLDAQIVCISYFGVSQNPLLVRYVIRRLRRLMPQARFLSCFWLHDSSAEILEDWREKVGADFVATSLKEAADICSRETPGASKTPEPRVEPRSGLSIMAQN